MPSPKGQLTNYIREWWPLTEAFAKSNLTSNQHKIIKGLQFLSYKWRKAEATASYRDLSNVTGIPRTKIGIYLKPLIEMNVVLEIKKAQGIEPGIYKINKDFRQWDSKVLDISIISPESMKLVVFECDDNCHQSSDSHHNRDSLQSSDSLYNGDSDSHQSSDSDSLRNGDTLMPMSPVVERSSEVPKEIFKEIDKENYITAADKIQSTYEIQSGIQEAAATAYGPPYMDLDLSKVMQYADKLYPAMINGTHQQEFIRFLTLGLSADLLIRGIHDMRLDNKPWKWLFKKFEGQYNDGIRTVEDAERWEAERSRQHISLDQWKSRPSQNPKVENSKYDVWYQAAGMSPRSG